MKYIGKVHIFGDNFLCDHMISGKYLSKSNDMKDLVPYLMHDIDENFSKNYLPGDIIVAGENFGAGSTREHAVLVLKEAGTKCIVAKSFSRSFYRNGINQGIALVESDWDGISDGDMIEVNLDEGLIKILDTDKYFNITPLIPIMKDILNNGGLINYYNSNNSL